MGDNTLNGSVDLLAKAMRDEMATKTDIETTNHNMQAQFAEQEKKIGQLIGG